MAPLSSSSAAVAAICSVGSRTVVRGGLVQIAATLSSNPTTDTSALAGEVAVGAQVSEPVAGDGLPVAGAPLDRAGVGGGPVDRGNAAPAQLVQVIEGFGGAAGVVGFYGGHPRQRGYQGNDLVAAAVEPGREVGSDVGQDGARGGLRGDCVDGLGRLCPGYRLDA
jgi:hypothetical protein